MQNTIAQGLLSFAILEDGRVYIKTQKDGSTIFDNDGKRCIEIAASGHHVIALFEDGSLRSWSINAQDFLEFPESEENKYIVQIATNDQMAFAVFEDEEVMAWGYLDNGDDYIVLPILAQKVRAKYNIVYLFSDNVLYSWDMYRDDISVVPSSSLLDNDEYFVDVAIGALHSIALTNTGRLIGWGDNSYDRLTIPQDIGPVKKIATANTFSIAVLDDGGIKIWGAMDNVEFSCKVIDVSAEGDHVMVLLEDGSIIAWGLYMEFKEFDQQFFIPNNNPFIKSVNKK